MRAVAFSVGVSVCLGVASIAVASFGDSDDPVATARYLSAPAETPTAPLAVAERPAAPEPSSDAPRRHFTLAVDDASARVEAGGDELTGLATTTPPRRQQAFAYARSTTTLSGILQDPNVRRGFGEMQALGEKARLFLFAGDQGGVWTYNFTRDQGGVKAAGWTTERADGLGERRVGLAWQRGRTRISLSGMERKFCAFGAEMKDRVLAMTVSFSPGWSSKRDHQPS